MYIKPAGRWTVLLRPESKKETEVREITQAATAARLREMFFMTNRAAMMHTRVTGRASTGATSPANRKPIREEIPTVKA